MKNIVAAWGGMMGIGRRGHSAGLFPPRMVDGRRSLTTCCIVIAAKKKNSVA
jgi:hypothetical protein